MTTINTNTNILTLNTPKPPSKLIIGYMIVTVDMYIPTPL